MDFKGAALRPVSSAELDLIAGYLGCEIACVRAVLAVETAGKGFGTDGRPTILPERHIFWRELGPGAKRDAAVNAGLASRTPGGYPRTHAARYELLDKWMKIDPAAALRSCSWGLGQVMGFNHAICGFDTVDEFVRAMMRSEGAQLYAMARFIVANSLQGYLRARKWASFARGYNGTAYKKNAYDTKLAEAYAARPAGERRVPPPATVDALLAAFSPDYRPTPNPAPAPPLAPDGASEPPRPDDPGPVYPPPSGIEWKPWAIAGGVILALFILVLLKG